jgi:hypothetical protein
MRVGSQRERAGQTVTEPRALIQYPIFFDLKTELRGESKCGGSLTVDDMAN